MLKSEVTTSTIWCGTASVQLSALEKNEYATNLTNTGLAVWFAATNMCTFVRDHLSLFDVGSTLELGSGTGLVGLMLLSLRAQREAERQQKQPGAAADVIPVASACIGEQGAVLLTDGPEEVMDSLRGNFRRNRSANENATAEVGAGAGAGAGASSNSCEQLWWGASSPQLAALQARPSFARIHNILGSDLFYNSTQRQVVVQCFETVQALLSRHEMARFHLSFTRRNLDIDTVLEVAAQAGFTAELAADYCFDLYGSNTEGCTALWRDVIYSFRRTSCASAIASSTSSAIVQGAEPSTGQRFLSSVPHGV